MSARHPLKLTFYGYKCLDYVLLSRFPHRLFQFHNNPLHCSKCTKHNHREAVCKGLLPCSRCSVFYSSNAYTSTHGKCSNRGGNYTATLFRCPVKTNQNRVLECANAKSENFLTARAAMSSLSQGKSSTSLNPSHKSDETLQPVRQRIREVDKLNNAMMVRHSRDTYASKSGGHRQLYYPL